VCGCGTVAANTPDRRACWACAERRYANRASFHQATSRVDAIGWLDRRGQHLHRLSLRRSPRRSIQNESVRSRAGSTQAGCHLFSRATRHTRRSPIDCHHPYRFHPTDRSRRIWTGRRLRPSRWQCHRLRRLGFCYRRKVGSTLARACARLGGGWCPIQSRYRALRSGLDFGSQGGRSECTDRGVSNAQ
jgi:hypothetical protein